MKWIVALLAVLVLELAVGIYLVSATLEDIRFNLIDIGINIQQLLTPR